ncbi:MAG TPA: hypothetical protein VI112_03180 [Bacteroidia bacterium]|jgi:hypothetical protein
MKTKLFFIAAIAGSLFFAACSGGVSDQTKKDVAAFDTAWMKMKDQAHAFSDSLDMAIGMCEKGCKPDSSMACCEHMKHKMDSMMMPCMNDMKGFQDMKNMMMDPGMKSKMDSAETSFAAFKEKVNKGEIKDEEAKKTLADFQNKLNDGNKMLSDWMGKFNDARKTCMMNMQNCMMACKDMKCTDKKCMEMEKKNQKK